MMRTPTSYSFPDRRLLRSVTYTNRVSVRTSVRCSRWLTTCLLAQARSSRLDPPPLHTTVGGSPRRGITSVLWGTTVRLGESRWRFARLDHCPHLRGSARRSLARNRSEYVRWPVRSRRPPNARAEGEGVGSRAVPRKHRTAAQALVMGGSCRHPIGWRRLRHRTRVSLHSRQPGCTGVWGFLTRVEKYLMGVGVPLT
jgi:hypothetical protein